jgi:hypothetical protein
MEFFRRIALILVLLAFALVIIAQLCGPVHADMLACAPPDLSGMPTGTTVVGYVRQVNVATSEAHEYTGNCNRLSDDGADWLLHEIDTTQPGTYLFYAKWVCTGGGWCASAWSGAIFVTVFEPPVNRVVHDTTCLADLDADGDVDTTDLSIITQTFRAELGRTDCLLEVQ